MEYSIGMWLNLIYKYDIIKIYIMDLLSESKNILSGLLFNYFEIGLFVRLGTIFIRYHNIIHIEYQYGWYQLV